MARLPRGVSFAAKAAFSLGLLVVLLVRLDVGAIARALRAASWPLLAGGAALLLLSNVLGSVQWGALLSAQNVRAPRRRITAAYFVGLFFNNFLPGGVGGDLARVSGISEHAPGLAAVVSATVMDRLIGFFTIAAFGVISLPFSLREVREPVIAAIVAASFAAAAGAIAGARSHRLLGLATFPFRVAGATGLVERVERGAASLRSLARRGRLLAGVLLLALVIQVLRIYVHYLVARALGIRVSQAALWTFVPILAVVAALPVSLNGLGVREWAATVLLPSAGVSAASAFAWQLLTYLIALVLSLIGAAAFLHGSLRAAAQRGAAEAALSGGSS